MSFLRLDRVHYFIACPFFLSMEHIGIVYFFACVLSNSIGPFLVTWITPLTECYLTPGKIVNTYPIENSSLALNKEYLWGPFIYILSYIKEWVLPKHIIKPQKKTFIWHLIILLNNRKTIIDDTIRKLLQHETNIIRLWEDSANNVFVTSIKLVVVHHCCEISDLF